MSSSRALEMGAALRIVVSLAPKRFSPNTRKCETPSARNRSWQSRGRNGPNPGHCFCVEAAKDPANRGDETYFLLPMLR